MMSIVRASSEILRVIISYSEQVDNQARNPTTWKTPSNRAQVLRRELFPASCTRIENALEAHLRSAWCQLLSAASTQPIRCGELYSILESSVSDLPVWCSRVGKWRVTFTGTFPQTPLRTGLDTFASSGSPELTCFVWGTGSLSGLQRGLSHNPPLLFF